MVADEVFVVALVAVVVVVGVGFGIVAATLHHRPGDAHQGVCDSDRGFLLVAPAEPAGQAAEPGPGRVAVRETHQADSTIADRRCRLPWRVAAFLRLPADKVVAGGQPGPGGQVGAG